MAQGGKALAAAVRRAYDEGQTDYSLAPLRLTDAAGKAVGAIENGDGAIFCCRRGEREVELTEAFTDPAFDRFPRTYLDRLRFVILTMYHEKFKNLPIAFAPAKVVRPLAQCVAEAGMKQFHCSESEKFAHVTFFFNGGENKPFAGEDDVCIPSPKGIPFDQKPELSLPKVADRVIEALDGGYRFILTNFANGDVIGHTANDAAKIKAAVCVDRELDRVLCEALQRDYVVMVTADHGNLELMHTAEGKPHVAHTTNKVPFLCIDPRAKTPLPLHDGSLSDVSPTVLRVLGLDKPACMEGAPLCTAAFGKERRVLLIVLDGWGFGREDDSNPIYLADTPHWDALIKAYPPARLNASGPFVGLAEGKAGNSEAGHCNLGAGRVVEQDDVRLDRAMRDGSFEENPVFLDSFRYVQQNGSALHLIALLTKKSSHGSVDYPLALARMAKAAGVEQLYIHIIFDGRSTEPGSAPALLTELDEQLRQIGLGKIVSGIGRGIALDRDGNYARIEQAYASLTGTGGTTYTEGD